MNHIKLTFANRSVSSIVGNGVCAEQILKELGDILGLEVSDGSNSEEPGIEITDWGISEYRDSWIAWEGSVNQAVAITWCPEELRYRFQLKFRKYGAEMSRIVMRRLLDLTVLREVKLRQSLLCHGALLQVPETGDAFVLIGRSGMGKTTASRRFAAQGGRILSDDKFVLSLYNGIFYGQPLPTWSRYLTDNVCVPFGEVARVRGLFILGRGHGDTILPIEKMHWTLEMLNSFQLPLSVPVGWLPKSEVRTLLDLEAEYLPMLETRFGLYQMEGDLDGKIYEEVKRFSRDKNQE